MLQLKQYSEGNNKNSCVIKIAKFANQKNGLYLDQKNFYNIIMHKMKIKLHVSIHVLVSACRRPRG